MPKFHCKQVLHDICNFLMFFETAHMNFIQVTTKPTQRRMLSSHRWSSAYACYTHSRSHIYSCFLSLGLYLCIDGCRLPGILSMLYNVSCLPSRALACAPSIRGPPGHNFPVDCGCDLYRYFSGGGVHVPKAAQHSRPEENYHMHGRGNGRRIQVFIFTPKCSCSFRWLLVIIFINPLAVFSALKKHAPTSLGIRCLLSDCTDERFPLPIP